MTRFLPLAASMTALSCDASASVTSAGACSSISGKSTSYTGARFKVVSDQLEQVFRGLGEMQSLATGVGDLKRMMTNVRTRGAWGEVTLANILEQVMAADQFEKNVEVKPGSNQRVEVAIKLPGGAGGP